MDKLESYRDLLKEIELWEIRLDDLNKERNYLVKKMSRPPINKLTANYDGMPKAGMAVVDFVGMWDRVREIDEKIGIAQDILSLKREAKRKMEKVMSEMDTLEYKIAYGRDVERKPLYEIAQELGYSYGWIRQCSMRIKRLRTG